MSNDQQIATIKTALAAIDTSIAQTESALRSASTPDDIRSLTSTLVDLRSERSRLQAQLDNLEAAEVAVSSAGAGPRSSASDPPPATPVSKSQLASLSKQLGESIVSRSIVNATLKSARSVVKNARRLRAIGRIPPSGKLPPRG
jgi:septal ring factor EnvC (AmiA/AmiB activator)